MRPRERSAFRPSRIIAAGALALSLSAPAARAQTTGDRVRITTDAGIIDGALVDRLPEGYLVRVGDGTHVVPYASVKAIVKVDAAPPPPAAPTAAPAPSSPVVVVLPPDPPAPPGLYYAPGTVLVDPRPPRRWRSPTSPLMAGGKTMLSFGILGLVVGAVLSPVGHAIKSANTCHDPSGTLQFNCDYGSGTAIATAGDINLIAGTLLTLGGIAMMVSAVAAHTTALRKLPNLTVAARGAALRWTF